MQHRKHCVKLCKDLPEIKNKHVATKKIKRPPNGGLEVSLGTLCLCSIPDASR